MGRAIRMGQGAEQERNPFACTVLIEARHVKRALLEQHTIGRIPPVRDDALRHELPPVAAAAVVTRVTDEVVALLRADGDVLVAEAAERGVFLDPRAGIAWVDFHQPAVLLADLAELGAGRVRCS